jgi:hypothetical protein
MVTHVVLFTMKDRTGASAERVRELLLGMRGKIPGLQSIEAGVDYAKTERSYDVALVTHHDDRAALDAYQVHPVHEVVKKAIAELRDASVAVDFES